MTNLFQTIWFYLTTPNEMLTNLICSPLLIVDAYVGMFLFVTILNFEATKKEKLWYVGIVSMLALSTRFLIPNPYGTFINMIAIPFFIMYIFKTSLLKSVLAELLPLLVSALVEPICAKFYILIFQIPLETAMTTPLSRMFVMLLIYAIIYSIGILSKKFDLNIHLLDDFNFKSKVLLTVTFCLGLVSIGIQYYIVNYYSNNIPVIITLLSTSILLIYFFISLYGLVRTNQLELTKQHLEESELYNKTLSILYDNIRCFKHDFSNMVQAIGGYVKTEDMPGLTKYYAQLSDDCQKVKNLTALNPMVINNPATYSLLTSKYYAAESKGISIQFDLFMDLSTLHMKIYEFCKVLGILLDNAIEASSECPEKIIHVKMRVDSSMQQPRQLLIIENTYADKDVNLEKIFEKSFSTKPHNTGLGLWEIRKILRRHNNLNLYTTKNEQFFIQQLEIYP